MIGLKPVRRLDAADPNEKASKADGPSQRPFETISALATKLGITPNASYKKDDYPDMVKDILERAGNGGIVLLCWQHQDILPKAKGDHSIMTEIVNQTGANPSALGNPPGPWPGDRFDLVFVVDLADSENFSAFTQVSQLLLAGDSSQPIPKLVMPDRTICLPIEVCEGSNMMRMSIAVGPNRFHRSAEGRARIRFILSSDGPYSMAGDEQPTHAKAC